MWSQPSQQRAPASPEQLCFGHPPDCFRPMRGFEPAGPFARHPQHNFRCGHGALPRRWGRGGVKEGNRCSWCFAQNLLLKPARGGSSTRRSPKTGVFARRSYAARALHERRPGAPRALLARLWGAARAPHEGCSPLGKYAPHRNGCKGEGRAPLRDQQDALLTPPAAHGRHTSGGPRSGSPPTTERAHAMHRVPHVQGERSLLACTCVCVSVSRPSVEG